MRPIRFTKKMIHDAIAEFTEQLYNLKMNDGKVTYSKSFTWKDTENEEKVKLVFTPEAYFKQLMLLMSFDSEVAWHGVAHRDAESDTVFYITDILVYPQEVTGATVTTDQVKYQTWLYQQPDEVFNNIRFQGHSHVNMGTTPSGTDIAHQTKILEQLNDDMFYIFLIINKSLKYDVKVFDMKNNTLYETNDIEIRVMSQDVDYTGFIDDAKKIVVKKVGSYGGSYGGYTGSGYKKPAVPSAPSGKPATTTVQEKKKEPNPSVSGGAVVGGGWAGRGSSALNDYYDDPYYGYF